MHTPEPTSWYHRGDIKNFFLSPVKIWIKTSILRGNKVFNKVPTQSTTHTTVFILFRNIPRDRDKIKLCLFVCISWTFSGAYYFPLSSISSIQWLENHCRKLHKYGGWGASQERRGQNIFFFFNVTILYWFCHISTWIHHRYTRLNAWVETHFRICCHPWFRSLKQEMPESLFHIIHEIPINLGSVFLC